MGMGMGKGSADFFYREAQRLGYAARSAFKLLEMQRHFRLISPGAAVLDLGCAPGAWLQVACQHLGPFHRGGAVLGVDRKPLKPPSSHCDSRVSTLCADVTARDFPLPSDFSVVLSDMCPSVSGIPTKDAALSCQLAASALSLALGPVPAAAAIHHFLPLAHADADADADAPGVLLRGGNLVIKLLESEDAPAFAEFCKARFSKVSWFRPKATRSCSREIYLVSLRLK